MSVLRVAARVSVSSACGLSQCQCFVWPESVSVLRVAGVSVSDTCGRNQCQCHVWPESVSVLRVSLVSVLLRVARVSVSATYGLSQCQCFVWPESESVSVSVSVLRVAGISLLRVHAAAPTNQRGYLP